MEGGLRLRRRSHWFRQSSDAQQIPGGAALIALFLLLHAGIARAENLAFGPLDERPAKLLFLQSETALTRDIEWREVDFPVDWGSRRVTLRGRFKRQGWSLRVGGRLLLNEDAVSRGFVIHLPLLQETNVFELTAARGDEIETQDYTIRVKDWEAHQLELQGQRRHSRADSSTSP